MWLRVIILYDEVLGNLSCTKNRKKALKFINGAKIKLIFRKKIMLKLRSLNVTF